MRSLLYNGPRRLVLASRSPRRQDLLSRLAVDFDIDPADVDETHPADMPPPASAVLIAERKAEAVAARQPDALVIGADTMVVLDGEILGKPRDPGEARAMLGRMLGRTHTVVTGLAILDTASGTRSTAAEETRVTMRHADSSEIARYVDGGEPMDKAGSYGAQGEGAVFIERVDGCFYNVVGLPLVRLHGLLAAADAAASGAAAGRGDGTARKRDGA
jgi:septum formation protein